MAKRFTDTDKWKREWFTDIVRYRALKEKYKKELEAERKNELK